MELTNLEKSIVECLEKSYFSYVENNGPINKNPKLHKRKEIITFSRDIDEIVCYYNEHSDRPYSKTTILKAVEKLVDVGIINYVGKYSGDIWSAYSYKKNWYCYVADIKSKIIAQREYEKISSEPKKRGRKKGVKNKVLPKVELGYIPAETIDSPEGRVIRVFGYDLEEKVVKDYIIARENGKLFDPDAFPHEKYKVRHILHFINKVTGYSGSSNGVYVKDSSLLFIDPSNELLVELLTGAQIKEEIYGNVRCCGVYVDGKYVGYIKRNEKEPTKNTKRSRFPTYNTRIFRFYESWGSELAIGNFRKKTVNDIMKEIAVRCEKTLDKPE